MVSSDTTIYPDEGGELGESPEVELEQGGRRTEYADLYSDLGGLADVEQPEAVGIMKKGRGSSQKATAEVDGQDKDKRGKSRQDIPGYTPSTRPSLLPQVPRMPLQQAPRTRQRLLPENRRYAWPRSAPPPENQILYLYSTPPLPSHYTGSIIIGSGGSTQRRIKTQANLADLSVVTPPSAHLTAQVLLLGSRTAIRRALGLMDEVVERTDWLATTRGLRPAGSEDRSWTEFDKTRLEKQQGWWLKEIFAVAPQGSGFPSYNERHHSTISTQSQPRHSSYRYPYPSPRDSPPAFRQSLPSAILRRQESDIPSSADTRPTALSRQSAARGSSTRTAVPTRQGRIADYPCPPAQTSPSSSDGEASEHGKEGTRKLKRVREEAASGERQEQVEFAIPSSAASSFIPGNPLVAFITSKGVALALRSSGPTVNLEVKAKDRAALLQAVNDVERLVDRVNPGWRADLGGKFDTHPRRASSTSRDDSASPSDSTTFSTPNHRLSVSFAEPSAGRYTLPVSLTKLSRTDYEKQRAPPPAWDADERQGTKRRRVEERSVEWHRYRGRKGDKTQQSRAEDRWRDRHLRNSEGRHASWHDVERNNQRASSYDGRRRSPSPPRASSSRRQPVPASSSSRTSSSIYVSDQPTRHGSQAPASQLDFRIGNGPIHLKFGVKVRQEEAVGGLGQGDGREGLRERDVGWKGRSRKERSREKW